MKKLIKYILLLISIYFFVGCAKQLPEKDLSELKSNKKIGILSNIQNTIFIRGMGHKSISDWNINDYLETIIYTNMNDTYKNIKIVPRSRNAILLNEEFWPIYPLLRTIVEENKLDAILLITNSFEGKAYEPGLNYKQRYSLLSGNFVDSRKELKITIGLYEPQEGDSPMRAILHKTFGYKYYDNKEELISNYQEGSITQQQMKILETTFKKLLNSEINHALKKFKLIN